MTRQRQQRYARSAKGRATSARYRQSVLGTINEMRMSLRLNAKRRRG